MADPNAIYKSGFQALADKLGRVPRVTDPEWLELGNEYSRSYSQERDIRLGEEAKASRVASAAAGRPESARFSREPAPQARTGGAEARARGLEEGLSGPRINAEPGEAESVLSPPSAAPRDLQGARGPTGGLICRCQACGLLWERPKGRGRPAFKCEECR